MPTGSKKKGPAPAESPLRRRVLDAAFSVFTEDGYAAASTLEIATRAKVSKRDLYSVAESKHDLLVACITERAAVLSAPIELPQIGDRASLERALITLGGKVVRTAGHPNAIAIFRLAIAEAERTPGHLLPRVVADVLDRNEHRRTNRRDLWRQHGAEARRRAAACERVAVTHTRAQTSERDRSIDGDGLGL